MLLKSLDGVRIFFLNFAFEIYIRILTKFRVNLGVLPLKIIIRIQSLKALIKDGIVLPPEAKAPYTKWFI